MRLYNAYMLFRIADMANRRMQRRKPSQRQVKLLTDKEIEKRYASSRKSHRPHHRVAWNRTPYNRANGRVVGIAFLLILIVFLLLTIVVNMPLH